MWNEPDLTDYFNENNAATSATFFAGNSEDYTDMYLAAQNGLRVRAFACRSCLLPLLGQASLPADRGSAHGCVHE